MKKILASLLVVMAGFVAYQNPISAYTRLQPVVPQPGSATQVNCPYIYKTPYFTEVYGYGNLKKGDVVVAYSPRGKAVGCFKVKYDNMYGLMRVYGKDGFAGKPGMEDGESIRIKVLNARFTSHTNLTFQPDWWSHRLDLVVY